jgi:hypothetical protein
MLSQRMLGSQSPQLRDKLAMPAWPQIGIDAGLCEPKLQLGEPPGFPASECLGGNIG